MLVHRLRPKYRLSVLGKLGIDAEGTVEISCYGLGCQVSYTWVKAVIEFYTLALFLLTPIDEEFLEVHILVSTKNVLNKAITLALRHQSMAEISYNLEQDVLILENKIYRHQLLLSEADRPIIKYRPWTQQFYSHEPIKTQECLAI